MTVWNRLISKSSNDVLDESTCRFVSSRGILKSCAVRSKNPRSSKTRLSRLPLGKLRPGNSIYVCPESLRKFAAKYLPKIKVPFYLVVGDSDFPACAESLGRQTIKILLQNPKLLQLFSQNADIDHPKLHQMPIGIDYHTLASGKDHSWGDHSPPLEQETQLRVIRRNAPDLNDKSPLCYSNWHFALQRGNREECYKDIDHANCIFEPEPVKRLQSWKSNANYLFTISPLGSGLDCHRTWEALVLGSVPIVQTSPLDPLYDNLPVVIVRHWDEITPSFLARTREAILETKYDFTRLYLKYWADTINGRATAHTAAITYQQFLHQN